MLWRRQSVYNTVAVHGHDEARRAKIEARRAGKVKFFREGMFPSHELEGVGSAASFPDGVRGEAPATSRLKTFYRLLLSVLLILNLFKRNFRGWGPSHRRPHSQIFVGVRTAGPPRHQCLRCREQRSTVQVSFIVWRLILRTIPIVGTELNSVENDSS